MKTRQSTKQKRGEAVRSTERLGFDPSFMVWVDGECGPAKRHNELGLAMEEAERLCRKENKLVYVMVDAWKCEPTAPPVKWTSSKLDAAKSANDYNLDGQPALPPAPGSVRWWPKQDERPPRGWWAGGEYMNVCRKCGAHFIGDKRAGHCADCAYADSPNAAMPNDKLSDGGPTTPDCK